MPVSILDYCANPDIDEMYIQLKAAIIQPICPEMIDVTKDKHGRSAGLRRVHLSEDRLGRSRDILLLVQSWICNFLYPSIS